MYSIYFIYKQYYTVYIYDYTYHIYCMRLTIVSLLNLIGFVHVCANHFLFVFIQLMASCLVSLSIDRAWEGRSLTSWIVLNSNYVTCLTFRLRLGLQPSQVVDSTDYRKDCEEFYEPLGFFYISSFKRLCLRIVLHPPIQQRKTLSWGLWRIYHLPNAVQRWRSWAWKRHTLAFGDDGYMTGPRMDSASILEVKWFLW